MKRILVLAALFATFLVAATASATVGTTFPAGFPVITGRLARHARPRLRRAPVRLRRTPVIFLHGNNDTPFPTACNPYGNVHDARAVLRRPRLRAERALGARLPGRPVRPARRPDEALRRRALDASRTSPTCDAFVHAVLEYTRREAGRHRRPQPRRHARARVDAARTTPRRSCGASSRSTAPNHGIINCSPVAANYWQLAALGGFTPDSAVCQEYGSPTRRSSQLAERRGSETPGARPTSS